MTAGANPARAYWNHRETLAAMGPRLRAMAAAVGRGGDLPLPVWTQLIALALELRPDLILELGRGLGNSTCAFTEAAGALRRSGTDCRVLSLCLSEHWYESVASRIAPSVPPDWFEPLTAMTTDITAFNFAEALRGRNRVLIFWDAHGRRMADCVLAGLMPQVADREHAVVMHDMSDGRHPQGRPDYDSYRGNGMWWGASPRDEYLRLGWLCSREEQALAVYDFASRNHVELVSGDHEFHTAFEGDAGKREEMTRTLGDLYSPSAHWLTWSLNAAPRPIHFPRKEPPPAPPAKASLLRRLKAAVKVLLGRTPI